jgi:hypothetical protein
MRKMRNSPPVSGIRGFKYAEPCSIEVRGVSYPAGSTLRPASVSNSSRHHPVSSIGVRHLFGLASAVGLAPSRRPRISGDLGRRQPELDRSYEGLGWNVRFNVSLLRIEPEIASAPSITCACSLRRGPSSVQWPSGFWWSLCLESRRRPSRLVQPSAAP